MSDVLPWTSRSVRRADGWPLDDFWCPRTRSAPGWAYEIVNAQGELLDRAMSLRVARRAAKTILMAYVPSGKSQVGVVDIVSGGGVERMRVGDFAWGSLT